MLAKRVQELESSLTLAITSKAKAMKARGEKVIILASGEPDFDTPDNIKEAAAKAIRDGFTKYTASSGIDELKELIVEKFRRENAIEYKKSEVMVTCGGKQAIYNAIMAIVSDGDEVIVPSPYWVSYLEQVKLAGGKSVLVHSADKALDFEQLKNKVTDRTKMIILNSPNNPTGMVIDRQTLQAVAELAVAKKIYVLSDEVYEKLLYEGAGHVSIASFNREIRDLTITVNALSKTYAMTGWRIGYCGAVEEVMKTMISIQDHSTSNACSIAQKAAVEAMRGPQDSLVTMVEEFNRRRIYMVERLNAIPGVTCPLPQGAFYAFPDVSSLYRGTMSNSMTFAQQLLEEKKVALIPGIGFGSDAHIRISYASSMEDIKEGMDRLELFVKEHCA